MGNNKWYTKRYRRTLLDMHIEEWNADFLSKYDPADYIEDIKKANVQSVMIYANSHVGCCYWPDSSGYMHKLLNGRDIFGELIGLCHDEGLDVIVYYSLIFNNRAAEKNPQWMILDVNGKDSREKELEKNGARGRYGVCCPNSLEYRDFISEQIKDIFGKYQFEGIFYDMTFWPDVCYCNNCRKRFFQEVGMEIPEVVDWNDSNWLLFQKKREEWMVEFAEFANSEAKKCNNDVTVEHNSACLLSNWRYGLSENMVYCNDYLGGDYYRGWLEQSFVCKLYHTMTRNLPFEFMTSRCHPNIVDHTTSKTYEQLSLHAYTALAHNGAFLFIDAIDPAGTRDSRIYERLGKIFGQSCKVEKHISGKVLQDVSLFFSFSSKTNTNEYPVRIDDLNTSIFWRKEYTHLAGCLGAAEALTEQHIPYGVVGSRNLDQLDAKALVLSDVVCLEQYEEERIISFVNNGGALYISGNPSESLLRKLLGIKIKGKTKENITYISPTERGRDILTEIDPGYPLTYGNKMLIADLIDAELYDRRNILAEITLPYTVPQVDDKFASIHSNPPGIKTKHPALISAKFGEGRVTWSAGAFESVRNYPHKNAFCQLISNMIGSEYSINAEAPPCVEIVTLNDEKGKKYLISGINFQEKLPAVPVGDLEIRIPIPDKDVVGVYLLPEEEEIQYTKNNSNITFKMPGFEMCRMIMIKYL